jgi:hypothetical protein
MEIRHFLPAILFLTLLPLNLQANDAKKCKLPFVSNIMLHWSSTEHLDGSITVKVAHVEDTLQQLRDITGKVAVVAVAGPHSEKKSQILDDIVPHKKRWEPFPWETEMDEIRMAVVPP